MGPYDETNGGIQLNSTGRKSEDAPRLQKKRSRGRVQSENLAGQQRRGELSDGSRNDSGLATRGLENDAGQRKGSLRNAVRKLFGRRPKDTGELPPTRTTPPRHQYHKSEPPTLPPHSENPEYEPSGRDLAPQRILSAPLQPLQFDFPPSLQRVRSPFAVEFPQSARLKPLNLGSPFDAPGSQLRRRKTLPSILIAGDEADAIASSIRSGGAPPVPARPSDDLFRETPTPEIGMAISGIRNPKRRSRSVGDLKETSLIHPAERKRSEEIRFWKESFHGSVLRTSGFTVPARQQEADTTSQSCNREDAATPTRHKAGSSSGRMGGTFHSRQSTLDRLQSSPPYDMRSNSAFGTELSRDLEDRVAKLEANLHSFQRSLNRLQAEKNRRTVVIGDDSSNMRTSGVRRSNRVDELTPSMLVDDLHEPFANSHYLYHAGPTAEQHALRPSTAPHNLSLDTTAQPGASIPPVPSLSDSTRTPTPHNTTHSSSAAATGGSGSSRARSSPNWSPAPATGLSASERAPTRSASSTRLSTSPTVTFKSLYQMLSDERSARRRLESQLRGLRTEIQDLQFQVSAQPRAQSQRSSYMLAAVPSARLRDLLRETDDSPTECAARRDASPDGLGDPRTGAQEAVVVSRFSGSTTQQESLAEAGAGAGDDSEEDEGQAQTPCEVYETPSEGRSPFAYGRGGHEGGMF